MLVSDRARREIRRKKDGSSSAKRNLSTTRIFSQNSSLKVSRRYYVSYPRNKYKDYRMDHIKMMQARESKLRIVPQNDGCVGRHRSKYVA